jgi:drug/metabolite transporter (DMT)-like permease
MRTYYLPFAVAVGGSLLYHLSQRSIPKGANPFHATLIAYCVGAALCALCARLYPGGRSFAETLRGANWAVFAVGAAVVAIEVGVLLAYRAGWRVSVTAVAINVAVTALLVPVGVLLFKDELTPRHLLGLAFCVLGLVLVAKD